MICLITFLVACTTVVAGTAIPAQSNKLDTQHHDAIMAKLNRPMPPAAHMEPYHPDNKPSVDSIVHWYDPTRGQSSTILAGMRITASVPSVNLNNVPTMKSVSCTKNSVVVKFSSIKDIELWSNSKVLLIIASIHGCGIDGSNEFVLRLATKMTVNAAKKSIKFVTVDPKSAGVTGAFEMFAVPVAQDRQSIPTKSTNMYPMANLDRVGHGAVDFGTPYNNSFIIPLNVDMSINKDVNLPLGNVGILNAGCFPCGIHGVSAVIFRSFGKLFEKPEMSVEWTGHVEMEANIQFKLDVQANVQSSEVTIIEYPLTPINIPGVLILGPDVMLNARANSAILTDTHVQVNMTASVPNFRAFVSSAAPKDISGFTPIYTMSSDSHLMIDAKISISLIPKIAVVAKVFGSDLLHTSLKLDNRADIKFNVAEDGSLSTGSQGKKAEHVKGCVSLGLGTKLVGEIFGISTDLVTVPTVVLVDKCFTSVSK
ncbi:hypothetical protein QVD99_006221 [Batrachochytrium dendrobatidis]|nr:hypothetical protein O5D80_003436 [Batrachochytrium dendrobatidis]KAK5667003.1 hypothetical protein QVD99_006221 [Batrachochytrium dendrobatidis]